MNAKRLVLMIVVLSSACSVASAGEIFGKVVEGTSSVGEAAALEARCGARTYPAINTDKSGLYRMVLAENGKLSVRRK